MTTWLTIALIALATTLAYFVVRLALTLRTQDALIRALQYSVRLSKEHAATMEHRADMLETAYTQQQERIDWLVEQNGVLEDHNAFLERVNRKIAFSVVMSLPVMDGPTILASKGMIGLN